MARRTAAQPDSSADDRRAASPVRRSLRIAGRVQGVGFRPFVYRLASEEGLAGFVGNDARGVFVEVEGPPEAVGAFVRRLPEELPPLATIASLEINEIPARGETSFRIFASRSQGDQTAEISPDMATCPDCLAEIADPADRRHRYAFTNCTNCGPRYSIVTGVPYDRPNTTMAHFTMCPACRAEYENPADRRFHAQPNACPACGPTLTLLDGTGKPLEGDPIDQAATLLTRGRIVAVKGLGGFHLACLATDDHAVRELRRRKQREAKPLAVMAADLDAARDLAVIDEAAREALVSPERPIVLAPKQPDAGLSPAVAPGSELLGILLPYTPLHEMLLPAVDAPLVMTSGNPSAEPLCKDNDDALHRLAGIADAFLMHNRPIARGVDDSVVLAVRLQAANTKPAGESGELSAVVPLRRARGYVPQPLRLGDDATGPAILAVGGELKSTICLLDGDRATPSEHLGDLTNPAAYRNFVAAIEAFERLLDTRPEVLACDLHPDYASTRYARKRARDEGLELLQIQHHHAHVAACMAENDLHEPVLGLSCDGTGFGDDGTVWGCEILLADRADYKRAGCLRPFGLVGGDAASRETWRPAAGLLREAFGEDWPDRSPMLADVDGQAIEVAATRLESGRGVVTTSSLGRLFDAAAFLLGIATENRCEAQAPMALEASAAAAGRAGALPHEIVRDEARDLWLLDPVPMIRRLSEGACGPQARNRLAAGFHETVAAMLVEGALRVSEESAIDEIVLTGGCFANRLLLRRTWEMLRAAGKNVYIHRFAPPGDGGIALGQAVAARARLTR